MARSTEAKIIAEGVETRLQATWLRDAGCDIGQGYLFGKPGSAKALADLALAAPMQTANASSPVKAVG